MRSKFAALQITGCGLMVALWLSGYGLMLVHADHIHAVPILGAVFLIGLLLAWKGRWDDMLWVADILPTVGLIGTGCGVLAVALSIQGGGQQLLSMETVIGILLSLTSNITGMVFFGWLSLTQRICEPRQ